MTMLSIEHICFLLATIAFLALTSFAVSKMPRLWQNVMFIIAAVLCVSGIFYRYAMGMSFNNGLNLKSLAIQMMQVCNFNFILVILMLIPRCELARQYSIMFSMFAACTTFIGLPSDWASCNWYDITILNFWLNHVFAVALPLWMFSARRLKPKKEYALKITICVVIYFTVSYLGTLLLKHLEILPLSASFSFIFDTGNIGLLNLLYSIIPAPYFYLMPLIPVTYLFFLGFSWLLKNYKLKN